MRFIHFIKKNWRTVLNLAKIKLQDRYLGSWLGIFWVVLQPCLLLGIYTFVFGFLFKAKAPGATSTLSYAIWMISGLVSYLAFAEGLSTTAGSVLDDSNLVKNVAFDTEVLPFAAAITSFVPLAVGMLFLIVLLMVDGKGLSAFCFLLPLAVFLEFLFISGIGLFLGATTVFLRDIRLALPTVTMLMLFFTPIFYSVDQMPGIVRKVTFFNPLYQITSMFRSILIEQTMPDWLGTLYLLVVSLLLIVGGLIYFRRLKGYFEIAM